MTMGLVKRRHDRAALNLLPHSFGPKESPRRDEFVPQVCVPIRWPHCSSPVVHWFSFPSLQGKLTCEFKFAPFSCPHRRQYQQVCKGVCVCVCVCQCVCVWVCVGGGGGGGEGTPCVCVNHT